MIKPLTSLRFFFAMMVFSSHLTFIIKPEENSALNWINQHIFSEGFIGVSFFFILSGFILSYTYQEKIINRTTSTYDFWIARIARIYPLHILTIMMIVPLIFKEQIATGGIFILKFLSNLTLLQSFIPNSEYYFSLNAPSWSISNEWFFYLMFPAIVFFINSNNKLIWVLFFLLLIIIPSSMPFVNQQHQHYLFYINPVFRLTDFAIGIFLFNISLKLKNLTLSQKNIYTLIELCSIGLFVLFFVFHNKIPIVYRYSCYYWLPMSIIIFVFSLQKGAISGILSNSFLILLGEISFGIYMIHSVIIGYFFAFNLKFFHISDNYMIIFITLSVTLFLSYIIFIFYEKPCNKYIKHNAKIKKIFSNK